MEPNPLYFSFAQNEVKQRILKLKKGISNGLDIILDEFIKTNHKIVLPILSKRFATLLKMEICQKVGISQS